MTAPAGCQIFGRWRIIESDLWDTNYLDLTEPAHFTFGEKGQSEFAFGCVNATMDIEYSRTLIFFRFMGFDEGTEVSGSGSAELDDDGNLGIELSFDRILPVKAAYRSPE